MVNVNVCYALVESTLICGMRWASDGSEGVHDVIKLMCRRDNHPGVYVMPASAIFWTPVQFSVIVF